MGNVQISFEQALLADLELLERKAARDGVVRATDVTALLARYGTSFAALPRYLQKAVDSIKLSD